MEGRGVIRGVTATHAHTHTRRRAVLLVDGTHVCDALHTRFPGLNEGETRTLMDALVTTLEAAYGVEFVHRILHEATPDGRPSTLALILSSAHTHTDDRHTPTRTATHDDRAHAYVCKTQAMGLYSGRPVDTDTLEPREDETEATLLVDTGVAVAMSLDLIRHTHAQTHACAAVVITAKADMSEALEMAQQQLGGRGVWVCGLTNALPPALLEKYCKPKSGLEAMLEAASERLWTKDPLKRCKSWRRWPYVTRPEPHTPSHPHTDSPTHIKAHAHACPDWSGCCYARAAKPFTRSKLDHMYQFLHPCPTHTTRTPSPDTDAHRHTHTVTPPPDTHAKRKTSLRTRTPPCVCPHPCVPTDAHTRTHSPVCNDAMTSGNTTRTHTPHTRTHTPMCVSGEAGPFHMDAWVHGDVEPFTPCSPPWRMTKQSRLSNVDGRLEEDWLNVVRYALRGADGAKPVSDDDDNTTDEERDNEDAELWPQDDVCDPDAHAHTQPHTHEHVHTGVLDSSVTSSVLGGSSDGIFSMSL